MKSFKSAICLLLIALFCAAVPAQKMKPEDVITKHLESIGTAPARAAVKNQMAVGEVVFTVVSKKSQTTLGRIVMVSEGTKNFLGMNLNAVDYSRENFSFDGKSPHIAYVRTNVRSDLGNFLLSNGVILEDGLLGGTLNTSWALGNLSTNKAKISFDGAKKMDGKEIYVLGYSPKGGSDIDIKLYFDKETFRHIRTEYKRVSSAAIGRTIDESARQSETRFKVTETYGDFRLENGLTLPHSYTINYAVTGQNGTSELEWKFNLTEFAFNNPLDAKTFETDAK